MQLLTQFLPWAEDKAAGLRGAGFQVEIATGARSANSSARMDVERGNLMGRITAWDAGQLDAQILETSGGSTVYHAQSEVDDPASLTTLLDPFFAMFD